MSSISKEHLYSRSGPPMRKGTTKRCRYGVCKSDTRYNSFKTNTYFFINFPKPCLEYRKKNITTSINTHIKYCAKCAKCALWVKSCGRSDRGFKSIDNVTKDTYICSLHFVGQKGPTELNPDPITFKESRKNKSNKKKIKTRTSPSKKVKREEEVGELEYTNIEYLTEYAQTSMGNEEVELILPDQTSKLSVTNEDTNCEGSSQNTRTIEIQTDRTKNRNIIIQIKWQQNLAMEKFINLIESDEKKCIFYTSLNFQQIQTLHRFVSPACENLECCHSQEIKLESSEINSKNKLTSLQQLILVLLRLRLGYLIEDLAYKFNIPTELVSDICNTWIDFLFNEFTAKLKPFMFPSRKIVAKTLPKIFQFVKNIRAIVDTVEFYCESPSNFGHHGYNIYSSYKAHGLFKVLIGCNPNGYISFVSDVFEGSMSDAEIFKQSKIGDLLETGDIVVAFYDRKDIAQMGILTKKVDKQQIYVEHIMGRIKNFRLISTVIPLDMRNVMTQIIFVCGCLVNFQTPVVFDESN